jgi:uncharacterized protein (TIGR00288 family)
LQLKEKMDLKATQKKIALFIDAENVPVQPLDFVITTLHTLGNITLKRAFGNWMSSNLNPWLQKLQHHTITPIMLPSLAKGKNAADIALSVSVMETIYTKDIDIIALMSSDCDFTPLVSRVIEEGKLVIGFGEEKTPTALVNHCSEFIYIEKPTPNLELDFKEQTQVTLTPDEEQVIRLLNQVITNIIEDDGWSNLGAVGTHISNHELFEHSNYFGHKKLSNLFKYFDQHFDLKRENNGTYVRRKNSLQ